MFSYELTTNPWVFYEFSLPPAEWYDVGRVAWKGKYAKYPSNRGFFSGWFEATLDSDHVRKLRFPNWLYEQRVLTLAMGLHPRLGQESALACLPTDLLRVICSQI